MAMNSDKPKFQAPSQASLHLRRLIARDIAMMGPLQAHADLVTTSDRIPAQVGGLLRWVECICQLKNSLPALQHDDTTVQRECLCCWTGHLTHPEEMATVKDAVEWI